MLGSIEYPWYHGTNSSSPSDPLVPGMSSSRYRQAATAKALPPTQEQWLPSQEHWWVGSRLTVGPPEMAQDSICDEHSPASRLWRSQTVSVFSLVMNASCLTNVDGSS